MSYHIDRTRAGIVRYHREATGPHAIPFGPAFRDVDEAEGFAEFLREVHAVEPTWISERFLHAQLRVYRHGRGQG